MSTKRKHRTSCLRILKQQLKKFAKSPTNLNLVNRRAISRSESGVGINPKRQCVIFWRVQKSINMRNANGRIEIDRIWLCWKLCHVVVNYLPWHSYFVNGLIDSEISIWSFHSTLFFWLSPDKFLGPDRSSVEHSDVQGCTVGVQYSSSNTNSQDVWEMSVILWCC